MQQCPYIPLVAVVSAAELGFILKGEWTTCPEEEPEAGFSKRKAGGKKHKTQHITSAITVKTHQCRYSEPRGFITTSPIHPITVNTNVICCHGDNC